MSSPPVPLPRLLPPAVAPAASTAATVDEVLPVLHRLLDGLRTGPLGRETGVAHEVKDDGSAVTAVDEEVDARITAAIADSFPNHGVVSEELDAVATDDEWQWVVDPVDGTTNFAAGLPYWGVAIALCHGGVPLLGVVDAPRLDHRWVAVRGRGCSRDGRAVRVRQGVDLDAPSTAHLPFLTSLSFLRRVRPGAPVRMYPRVLGAAAVDAAFVADGTALGSAVAKGRVWDVAAAGVLVEEAGGVALRLGDPVFPLAAGTDHTDLPCPAVFGPGQALVDELVTRLWPEEGSLVGR